jgi:tmRNA-binding protein
MNKEKADAAPRQIAVNRRARHDYFIEEHYEAGLVLQGWEVKSMREGRAQVADAYVKVLGEEAFLIGAHFLPASGISTHVHPDPTRSRSPMINTGLTSGATRDTRSSAARKLSSCPMMGSGSCLPSVTSRPRTE